MSQFKDYILDGITVGHHIKKKKRKKTLSTVLRIKLQEAVYFTAIRVIECGVS